MGLEDPYCYSQLSSPRHTRSIVLHPSKTDDGRITCELVEVNIDDAPRCEALSYTWNGEAPSEPLEILASGGSGGVQILLVTPNCARALRIIRKRLGRRRVAKVGLWVDAICINQSDNKEKGLQVAMMAEIYRTAESLLGITLPEFLEKKTAEPRDKVYALGNLCSAAFGAIEVDYDRSVEGLFTEATRCLIVATQNLEPLYTACSCKKAYDIPSWTVDWAPTPDITMERATRWITKARECSPVSNDTLKASFSDDGLVLKLFGKDCGRISTCVSESIDFDHWLIRHEPDDVANMVRKFLTAAGSAQLTSNVNLGAGMAEILRLKTVYASESDKTLRRMETESDAGRICDLMEEYIAAQPSTVMRREIIFMTAEGRIGTGNPNLESGDLICSFAGLALPFIVRRKGPYHELVSPAIVDGVTNCDTPGESQDEVLPWEIV
ncbi:hypothetical protein KJ359_003123 [Pestalotiopsis sp. 9143b]|nr:hypothetical protein KJ359_003123 [Pestalotiopsis sp. 9143b]